MSVPLDDRPWHVGHAAAAVVGGIAAVYAAATAIGPEVTDAETWRVLVPVQAMAQVALVAWWASRSARRRLSLGIGFDGGDLVGLPIGVGLQIAASLALLPFVVWVLDGEAPTQEVVQSASSLSGADIALVALGAGVLAPLSEELVFRGVLLRALLARRGARVATYGSAAAFAAIHLLDPNAWLVVPVLFVVGVVLARQAVATGRLARPFLTHAAFNLVAVASLFLAG